MYQLQKISDFENCEQIQALFSDLPKKPYCTNAKGFCCIRTKLQAIKHAYIQPNTPFWVRWLVFDVDYEQALFAYYDNHAPRPHLIIRNPQNGHAHYCYRLATPVGLTGKTSQKSIDYLQAVYFALSERLGADWGYSTNLIKNPTHDAWESFTAGQTDPYTLDELAEWLRLPTKAEIRKAKQERANDDYFGRNCSVFHATRYKAYAIAHKHDYNTLFTAVLAIANEQNAKFDNPMNSNEVRHIAKSIAKYCKSPRFTAISAEWFSRLQAHRGKQGGKAKGRAYQDKREQAKILANKGLSIRQIAEQIGVSKSAVANYLKVSK